MRKTVSVLEKTTGNMNKYDLPDAITKQHLMVENLGGR